ncbi:uncharacterized protein LOC144790842 [Lissotriton helveticus]
MLKIKGSSFWLPKKNRLEEELSRSPAGIEKPSDHESPKRVLSDQDQEFVNEISQPWDKLVATDYIKIAMNLMESSESDETFRIVCRQKDSQNFKDSVKALC